MDFHDKVLYYLYYYFKNTYSFRLVNDGANLEIAAKILGWMAVP